MYVVESGSCIVCVIGSHGVDSIGHGNVEESISRNERGSCTEMQMVIYNAEWEVMSTVRLQGEVQA